MEDVKKEVAPEVPVQKQQPIRNELSDLEKQEIKKQLFQVFNVNNLSIKQCKEILSEVININLDNVRPWNED
jgi:hypothetical protein